VNSVNLNKNSTFGVLVLASVFLGAANSFVDSDEVDMFTVHDRAMKLTAEIARMELGLHPASAEAECTTEMSNDLLLISVDALHLRLLVSLAARMKDEADEALVLKAIKFSGRQALGEYAMAEGDLDHVSVVCSTNSRVTAETQKMRNYLDWASTTTNALLAKLN
jgi:hypothetical protein